MPRYLLNFFAALLVPVGPLFSNSVVDPELFIPATVPLRQEVPDPITSVSGSTTLFSKLLAD
jgi:hypothetical protein